MDWPIVIVALGAILWTATFYEPEDVPLGPNDNPLGIASLSRFVLALVQAVVPSHHTITIPSRNANYRMDVLVPLCNLTSGCEYMQRSQFIGGMMSDLPTKEDIASPIASKKIIQACKTLLTQGLLLSTPVLNRTVIGMDQSHGWPTLARQHYMWTGGLSHSHTAVQEVDKQCPTACTFIFSSSSLFLVVLLLHLLFIP